MLLINSIQLLNEEEMQTLREAEKSKKDDCVIM